MNKLILFMIITIVMAVIIWFVLSSWKATTIKRTRAGNALDLESLDFNDAKHNRAPTYDPTTGTTV